MLLSNNSASSLYCVLWLSCHPSPQILHNLDVFKLYVGTNTDETLKHMLKNVFFIYLFFQFFSNKKNQIMDHYSVEFY